MFLGSFFLSVWRANHTPSVLTTHSCLYANVHHFPNHKKERVVWNMETKIAGGLFNTLLASILQEKSGYPKFRRTHFHKKELPRSTFSNFEDHPSA